MPNLDFAQVITAAHKVDTAKQSALALIASTRYAHETGGIIVAGTAIDTGRDSQALITGATVQAMIDSGYVCVWKTDNGSISLTAAQLIAIATAVRAHVQACFDRESQLADSVAAGTFTEAMLDDGWPA